MTEFIVTQQMNLRALIEDLMEREEGQDMIEYALLAALIAIVAVAALKLLGPQIVAIFTSVTNTLSTA